MIQMTVCITEYVALSIQPLLHCIKMLTVIVSHKVFLASQLFLNFTKQNQTNPGLVASYDIQPGNESNLL